jgi:hypothetical protein
VGSQGRIGAFRGTRDVVWKIIPNNTPQYEKKKFQEVTVRLARSSVVPGLRIIHCLLLDVGESEDSGWYVRRTGSIIDVC